MKYRSGYFRDRSVFSDGITIEKTMSMLVKYQNQAQLTGSHSAYLPWEGLNVVLNGSEGHPEMKIGEKSYVNAGGARENEGSQKECSIAGNISMQQRRRVNVSEFALASRLK